jgi:hypothetical protein
MTLLILVSITVGLGATIIALAARRQRKPRVGIAPLAERPSVRSNYRWE